MSTLLEKLVAQAEALTLEAKIKKAKENPYFFLTEFCYTQDEHWSHKKLESPFNLIPRKQYIQDICDIFQTEDLIAIEKTRQMMASWIMCALALWYTMFTEGRRTFIASKKEKDANALIDRIKIIYERLPQQLKDEYPRDPEKYLETKWSKRSAVIQGIPQGPDQVRSYTSNLIIGDEASFQDQVEKMFEAAQPSIQGGGKFVLLSTPNGREFFWRICYDHLD